MQKLLTFFAVALAGMLGGVDQSTAQVVQTKAVTNAQGEVVETPYLSRSELMDTRLGGPHGTVNLGQIMTVRSIEQAIRLLGEPDSTDVTHYPEGVRYDRLVVLSYKGMKIEYVDIGENIRVDRIEITNNSYYINIGKGKLRTGISSNRLSKNIRKAKSRDDDSLTTSHLIRVSAKEGSSKKGSPDLAKHEGLVVEVDENTGKVTKVRYYTTI
jgi:hypothetical protein